MTRKLLVAMLALGMGGGVALADGGTNTGGAPQGEAAKVKKSPKAEKLVGEVLDLNCYADHKASGEGHASCAAKCISAGAPIGLLSKNKVYVLVNGDHSLKLAEALGPSAGKTVTLTGHQSVLPGGTRTFDVESVDAAPAAPAKL